MFSRWNTRLGNVDEGVQSDGDRSPATESSIVVSDERAMSLSAVWACVRLLSSTSGTMPMPVYEEDAQGNRTQVPDTHYLARLLARPNIYMNGKEMRMALCVQRVLRGNAFAKIGRNGANRPVSLLPMQPGAVTVHREREGLRFTYSTDTGTETYWNRANQPPEIFHWRGFSMDGVMGMSALAFARHSMGVSIQAEQQAAKAFRGRPNGVIMTDTPLTRDQRTKMRERFDAVGQAETGNGSWWLMEGGTKWVPTMLPPDDLQMLESRQFQVADVCRFFGVPAVMVDGSAGAAAAWPASYEQQVLAYLMMTLKPYLEELEEKITTDLVMPGERVYAEHDTETLLRTDSQARAGFFSQMVQNGLMTRNEIRRRMNLPPMPGGDELTIQVNLTPADQLGESDGTQSSQLRSVGS